MLNCGRRFTVGRGYRARPVTSLPVLHHDAVVEAVSPAAAIDRVGEAFLRHRAGDWTMPAKVYLQSPPFGDFRAMPARGGGLALLKWITSFPGNPARGLPTVTGVICLSDAETGQPLMLLDGRSGDRAADRGRWPPWRRERSPSPTPGPSESSAAGCTEAWTARCLATAGYGPGVCFDPRPESRG